MITLHTRASLIRERIAMLRAYKHELRARTDRREAFRTFKQLCRDRVFDALAGHVKLKGRDCYVWYSDYADYTIGLTGNSEKRVTHE